nr:hypothetical protein GCM10020185_07680 [Pseudomonas brassicacearum subsp. brassicacearum]
MNPTGSVFAVRRNDTRLLEVINATLNQVSIAEQAAISKRWSAGSDLYLTDHRIQLTDREQRWLARHPVVRVVVNETSAPFTFFDADGDFRGISADLLELIRLRTGLRLDIQRRQNDSEMIAAVLNDQADMIAALLPSSERQLQLKFSRPYVDSSFVLLTRKQSDTPTTLDQFGHASLAIAKGNPVIEWLRSQYPNIQIIETDGPLRAVEMLAHGQVDGSVNSQVMANYFISSYAWRDRLQISSTVGTQQAMFALATVKKRHRVERHPRQGPDQHRPPTNLASSTTAGAVTSRPRNTPGAPTTACSSRSARALACCCCFSLAWNAYMQRQIRQRQRAELALNDQLEFMHSLLNGTPHPIYVRDRNGILQSCNDSYLQTFDVKREDVIGKNLMPSSMSNAFEAQEYQADYQRVMAEGTALIVDRPLHIGDRQLTIYHWILPYRNSAAEVQGIIGGWIDISERRQLFEELRASKQRADDANRAKSTFLATMSHEIRTPMNAVIGMLELALKHADKGHVDRSTIEVAYESASGMLELIGDILDIARIESGHLSLAPERVNLRALLQSVIRVFEGVARQKKTWRCPCSSTLPRAALTC